MYHLLPDAHIETEGIKCYRNPSGLVFSEAKELLLPEQDLPIHYGGIYFPRAVCKVSKFTPRQEQQTVKQDPSSKDSSQSVAKTGDMKEKENVKSSPPGPEECKLSENSAGDPHPVSQVDQSLPVASQGIPAAIMSQVPPSSVMSQGQPSVNQGPPVMSQGPSSMSQGPPVMSQGQPSMNQGLPMMSQGQPSMNQGLPMMSQAQPSMNQGLPMMSQGQPSMNQGLPMMSQGPPAMGQGPPNVSQVPPPVNQGSALGQGPPMMSQGPPVMGQGPPQMLNQPHQVMKGFPMIMNQFLQGAHPPMLNQGPPPMMNIGVPPPMMNQGPSQMMNPGLPMMGQGRPPQMMNQGQPPPGVGPWMNRGPPPPMMGQRPPFMNPGFNRMPLSVPPPGLHSTESGSKDLEQEAWEASVRSFTNSSFVMGSLTKTALKICQGDTEIYPLNLCKVGLEINFKTGRGVSPLCRLYPALSGTGIGHLSTVDLLALPQVEETGSGHRGTGTALLVDHLHLTQDIRVPHFLEVGHGLALGHHPDTIRTLKGVLGMT